MKCEHDGCTKDWCAISITKLSITKRCYFHWLQYYIDKKKVN